MNLTALHGSLLAGAYPNALCLTDPAVQAHAARVLVLSACPEFDQDPEGWLAWRALRGSAIGLLLDPEHSGPELAALGHHVGLMSHPLLSGPDLAPGNAARLQTLRTVAACIAPTDHQGWIQKARGALTPAPDPVWPDDLS